MRGAVVHQGMRNINIDLIFSHALIASQFIKCKTKILSAVARPWSSHYAIITNVLSP